MTDSARPEQSLPTPSIRQDVERIASVTGAALEQVEAIYELQQYRAPEVKSGGWFRRSSSQQVFRSLIQINFYPRRE